MINQNSMLFMLLLKQVISISQYNDHMILSQNEKYVIPSVYYKYNHNKNTENIIQDNKYVMFEHQLDIGKFIYGKLDKNHLWLLSQKNGKFDLYLIDLPIDIVRIRFEISIHQTNCYKIDILEDNQIIIYCFNECYNFYHVYNKKSRILKLHKLRREKCNIETYDSIILDKNFIIIQYDNFVEVLDHQFVKQCQMDFKHNINQIYYKDNLYIYTNQINHEVSQQTICNFKERSYTLHAFVIIGNKYQIFMDSDNNININGVSYKIDVKNLFFNDNYLIFQSLNTYYVYNYDNQKLLTTFQENENSKIFVNIELFDIYILYQNKIKLINIQEEVYQIIKSQYSLQVSYKEQFYLFIEQHNESSIMLSQSYQEKVVISKNYTQIRMSPFAGGNVQYEFNQIDNRDQIQVDVKVIHYKLRYRQECIFYQIYTHNKYNLYICQHNNLTITIYKQFYSTYDVYLSYHLDYLLTKNDSLIIQGIENNVIQYFILRVTEDHFKLYRVTNFIFFTLIQYINFDKLIVFDSNYIYYTQNDIIYRYVINLELIEVLSLCSTKIFIDQQNYIVYDSPYVNYYCQNNQHSQQFYVGQNVIDIKSFQYSITVIMKGQIQIYHRLNQNKIIYIGNLDLYDNEIDETCQYISDKELLYVRCHNRLLIFDSQQSLKQSLMKNFMTTHSFPLIQASKLDICFLEQFNQISCYLIYQEFQFTYQFIQQIHSVKVDLQIIAFNKYNQESTNQVILFQNDFQQKQDHFIKYQAYKGQKIFKLDIQLHAIKQQYLHSDLYELTRSIETYQQFSIKSLNFIVIIQNDDLKVYENDYVTNLLQIQSSYISIINNNIIYYQNNKSLYFYECNVYLRCNFIQQLNLSGILEFRVLQFGTRIIIQQNGTLIFYEYESKEIKKVSQINRFFQVYHVYKDIFIYLIDKQLTIEKAHFIQEYDLQYLIEMEDLAKINQLVILNDQIDICISDGQKVLIYRFLTNGQYGLRAVLFKENILGQRLQFQILQINSNLIIAFNYQTFINFYNYQNIQGIQYLYPIKIIQSHSGHIQLKGMQLFFIKERIVVVFKQGMDIKIIHLQLEQYLVIDTGVFQTQIVQLRIKNESQSIKILIEVNETDYHYILIVFLILIFVYMKFLQIQI